MKKTVLVTGASGGIGRAIVTKFAKEGYDIIYHYNSSQDEEFISRLSRTTNVLPIKADFKNCNEIITMFEKSIEIFGKIDCLVNNAGVDRVMPIIDENINTINDVLQINLAGAILLTSLVSKKMCEMRSGSIINISSIWGVFGGGCESVYSASKAGLIGFTKAIAKELGANGVRANSLSLGMIDTKMNNFLSLDEKKVFVSNTALQRMGTPEDVASVVYFLASEDSKFITGQNIGVDGGYV